MVGPQLHGTIGFCGKGWHMGDHRAKRQKEQMSEEKEMEELGKATKFRRPCCGTMVCLLSRAEAEAVQHCYSRLPERIQTRPSASFSRAS